MKKAMTLVLAILLLSGILPPALGEASPPISSGTVNKTTNIYWGKGEQFPILATVYAGAKLDAYEYDANWVLVLYKTYVTYMGKYTEQSFYGYIRRSDIDCEPPLEGEASPKADTGPGKKKGKRPKPLPNKQPAEPTPGPTKAPEGTKEPMPTVEQMEEEFDWIIRTNGLQTQEVKADGMTISCSFSLMAQKAGGTAASSDPAFNHGMHTPYAATAFYSMKLATQKALEELGLSMLTGTGGIDISMKASGAAFFLDTGAENFALVSFTLPMQTDGSFGVSVSGEMGSGTIKGDTGTTSLSGGSSLSIQLRKSGGGYKFVLVGLKPGGGNLEFPAVLEKTFADPDRFDKEAAAADARRKKAEAERDKWLEDMKKKAEEAADATEPTQDPLAPLVPTEEPLAPLTPTEDPLAPLTPTEDPLAPLTEDEAPPFPAPLGRQERSEVKCV